MSRSWVARSHARGRAFTLIEVLVVVGIIALLAGIALPVYQKIQRSGAMTRELSAGRQIMTAFHLHAAAHDGELLKGYDRSAGDVALPNGSVISGVVSERYAWRLAPYLEERVENILLLNEALRTANTYPPDSVDYQYRVSLHPSFGMNGYCIGGYDDDTGNGYYSRDCVTRTAGTSFASGLIVFASARFRESGQTETPGYFKVVPPRFFRTKWTMPFNRNSAPENYGYVDPRWNGKAMCAFLDGHVALLGESELTDSRHWSNLAAQNNDSNFFVPRQ